MKIKQQGDVLLEALIGVLLTAWLGAGMAYISTQLLQQKADTKIISAAVNEMKHLLEQEGERLCGQSPTMNLFSKSVNVQVTCTDQDDQSITSSAGTIEVSSPPKVVLSVAPQDIGISGDVPVTVTMGS